VLRRLGGWSYAHRRLVAGAWVLVVVAVAIAAGALSKPTNDAFNVPGTEAQRALDLLDEHFPGAGGATARLVFAAPPGHTLKEARYRSVVDPTVALAQKVPQSIGSGKAFAASLTFSKDDRIAFADLHFLVPVADLKDSTKDALRQVGEPARKAGLEVEFSGGVTATTSSTGGPVELIGVAVALVILLIAFGTLVTALLPLATALVGVAIGLLGIRALSGLTELNSTAPTLATMLGLAVGIDYALFIVSRHREQLAAGAPVAESVARAVGSAGAAVCFAGLTVVIALTGMVIVGIPFLSVMGLAAAGTVLVAVLVALTLLPALLGFAGARVGGGRHPETGPAGTLGARWARQVTQHPAVAIAGVVVVLGVIALPLTGLRLGLPDDSSKPAKSTERKAYDLLTRGFGPGFTGPLTVVGDARQVKDPKNVATQAVKALGTFPGVAAVSQPVFNDAGNIAIVSVTPSSGPASERTKDLVKLIRDRAADAERRYGIRGYVTGRTAINIDTSSKISAGLPAFLVVVVGLALVLLMIAFRSVAVPVKAVLGFLLTIASALGIATWTFQEGHLAGLLGIETPSPIVSFLPVLLIAILFGLAMDYEVFLVSRMREAHRRGAAPVAAVVGGFTASARVVTAAALIMVSVFAAFVIGDDVVIKSIAFSLAFGVLADAFLVRMTLVPGVLALLGARAWWLPGWLDRHLPHVDIEGEGDDAPATGTPSAV
jgi:RND superfamily putative drug exporter